MTFKTLACMVHKIWHASKSVTNGHADEPETNMPHQLFRSWGHNKQYLNIPIVLILLC